MLIHPIFIFTFITKLVQIFGSVLNIGEVNIRNNAAAEGSSNTVMTPDISIQQSSQVMDTMNSFTNNFIRSGAVTALSDQINVENLSRLPRASTLENSANNTIVNGKVISDTISGQITKALGGLMKLISGMATRPSTTSSKKTASEPTYMTDSPTKSNTVEGSNLTKPPIILEQLITDPMPPEEIVNAQILIKDEHDMPNVPNSQMITAGAVNPTILMDCSPDSELSAARDTVMFNSAPKPIFAEINRLSYPTTSNGLIVSNNIPSPNSVGVQESFIRKRLESLSSPKDIYAALTGIDTTNLGVKAKLCVKNLSHIAPTGLSLLAENLVMDGKVAVAGNLPFMSTVTVDGTLPSNGLGTVWYECGRGYAGMLSEGPIGSANSIAMNNALDKIDRNNALPLQNIANNNVHLIENGVL